MSKSLLHVFEVAFGKIGFSENIWFKNFFDFDENTFGLLESYQTAFNLFTVGIRNNFRKKLCLDKFSRPWEKNFETVGQKTTNGLSEVDATTAEEAFGLNYFFWKECFSSNNSRVSEIHNFDEIF